MTDPIQLDMSGAGHLVDPPIIDFLAHELDLRCYVAEFVPDPHVSSERKESVYIADGSQTARRISEFLIELGTILKSSSPIVRVAHGGGGEFDLYEQSGGKISLS